MSIAAYSTCRIRFTPADSRNGPQDFSERSLVELRQNDFADYSLRALDIANNRAEIFNIPVKRASPYVYGREDNQPDEVRHPMGTYYLWLNAASKDRFHEALNICFEQLGSAGGVPEPELPPRERTPSPRPSLRNYAEPSPPPPTTSRYDQQSPAYDRDATPSYPANTPTRPNRNEVLVHISQLGQYIRQGDVDRATEMAKKLAEMRVPLKFRPCREQTEDEILSIKVRIDSHRHAPGNSLDEISMGVYPSTTVRELRAAFEHSRQYPPEDQYFFVNGHLAHEDSTMAQLGVHTRSLFVLFVNPSMSIEVYSQCRIEFRPDDRSGSPRQYSERSLVEIRKYTDGGYSVRGVDSENNIVEIFNVPLQNANQYVRGRTDGEADEVPGRNGTYRLWLSAVSKAEFHRKLNEIFAQMAPGATSNNNHHRHPGSSSSDAVARDLHQENPRPELMSPNDILHDAHQLGERMQRGDADGAARLTRDLVANGVRLQVKASGNIPNENEFTIQVQLDGNEYGVDNHGPTFPVEVFPSTTVRELRAAFERSHDQLPPNQYLFANGCLRHDDESMRDLSVGPNSLFVLFLLTHLNQFHGDVRWKCTTCTLENSSNHAHCDLCMAVRTR